MQLQHASSLTFGCASRLLPSILACAPTRSLSYVLTVHLQQEVLVRLDEIEARVNNLPARGTSAPARDPSSSGASLHADHPHQPIMRRTSTRNLAGMGASNGPLDLRVAALEGKLAGVYNLNGKLMAVEALAAEMGVDIPDLEGVEGGGLPESMADASPRPGLGAASAAAEDVAGMMRGVSFHQGPAASSGEASTGLSPRGALLLDRMAASTSQPASRLGSPLGRGAAGGMGAQSRGTSPRNTARDPEAGLWPSVSGTVGTATSAHKQPLNMGSRLNETVAQLAQLQQEHQTLSRLVQARVLHVAMSALHHVKQPWPAYSPSSLPTRVVFCMPLSRLLQGCLKNTTITLPPPPSRTECCADSCGVCLPVQLGDAAARGGRGPVCPGGQGFRKQHTPWRGQQGAPGAGAAGGSAGGVQQRDAGEHHD